MGWHCMRVKHVPAASWHSVLAHAGRLHYCRFIPSGSRHTQLQLLWQQMHSVAIAN